jgi:hypothetical protein
VLNDAGLRRVAIDGTNLRIPDVADAQVVVATSAYLPANSGNGSF